MSGRPSSQATGRHYSAGTASRPESRQDEILRSSLASELLMESFYHGLQVRVPQSDQMSTQQGCPNASQQSHSTRSRPSSELCHEYWTQVVKRSSPDVAYFQDRTHGNVEEVRRLLVSHRTRPSVLGPAAQLLGMGAGILSACIPSKLAKGIQSMFHRFLKAQLYPVTLGHPCGQ